VSNLHVSRSEFAAAKLMALSAPGFSINLIKLFTSHFHGAGKQICLFDLPSQKEHTGGAYLVFSKQLSIFFFCVHPIAPCIISEKQKKKSFT
jgi:hypothetical protein